MFRTSFILSCLMCSIFAAAGDQTATEAPKAASEVNAPTQQKSSPAPVDEFTFNADPASVLRVAVTQGDWQQFHDKMESNYKTYLTECDTYDVVNGEWKFFLDREFVSYCAFCKNDDEGVRKALFIVAMYAEKDCTLPKNAEVVVGRIKHQYLKRLIETLGN